MGIRWLILCIGLWAVGISASDRQPPNIVILFADDLGYGDLGSYGNPYIRTPHLDQMAAEGQRWTDFYVASPVCSPSRGALLTGQHSIQTGLYGEKINVFHPEDPNGIPSALTTLPEALEPFGYTSAIMGKWHLGDSPDQFPTRHGFDYWFGLPYSNDMDRVGSPPIDEVMRAIAKSLSATARSRHCSLSGISGIEGANSKNILFFGSLAFSSAS